MAPNGGEDAPLVLSFYALFFLLIEIIEYKHKDTRSIAKERPEMEVE